MNKAICFDLDGTLWDSSKEVRMVWNDVLNKRLGIKISQEEMNSVMGKTLDKIAEIFLPNVDIDLRNDVVNECVIKEIEYLNDNGAKLFSGLEDTLKILHKDYKLFIVSNCQVGYLEAFLDYNKLNKYFDDYEMAGRTNMNKGDNIKLILARNNINEALYVGDTIMDKMAAEESNLPFIYARYGFGNIKNYEHYIDKISDLPNKVNEIFK